MIQLRISNASTSVVVVKDFTLPKLLHMTGSGNLSDWKRFCLVFKAVKGVIA